MTSLSMKPARKNAEIADKDKPQRKRYMGGMSAFCGRMNGGKVVVVVFVPFAVVKLSS